MFTLRRSPLAALLAAATLLAAAAPVTAVKAGPSVALRLGATSVTLSADLLNAASALQVTLDDVSPAVVAGGVAIFPIVGGVLDAANARGEIIHLGGLSLRAGGTTVTLTDFVIDTTGAQPRLTGLVTAGGNVVGRVPLFDLQLPELPLPLTPSARGKLTINQVTLTLTAEAAAALNATFNVSAFSAGLNIGTAKVKVVALNVL